jgi:hypothetical protein
MPNHAATTDVRMNADEIAVREVSGQGSRPTAAFRRRAG